MGIVTLGLGRRSPRRWRKAHSSAPAIQEKSGWARAIQRLVPVGRAGARFIASGTEATLMALRVARAFTGRSTQPRFKGHFHGWHVHMTSGYSNHFDGSPTPDLLAGVAEKSILVSPGDEAAVWAAFAANPDIAAVILEPTGSSFGQVPVSPDFLYFLGRVTEQQGALLIFDEVVTGFRVSSEYCARRANCHNRQLPKTHPIGR